MTTHTSQRQNLAQPTTRRGPRQQPAAISKLRAVVILAGSVRPTRLRRAVGRFVMELPVDAKSTLVDCWHEQVVALASHCGLDRLPMRVMVDRATPPARAQRDSASVDVRIECDPLAFRGTGGLLRDVSDDYADDELMLVAGSPLLLLEPLSQIIDALSAVGGDVRLLAEPDGTPAGLMLIRAGALRELPRMGFVDFKEQGLPAIARTHQVMVAHRQGPVGGSIRTLASYLTALRFYHRRLSGLPIDRGVMDEAWRPAFRIVESGAHVDPSAVIHESVILAGASVAASAVVVRSVVTPGAHVPEGESIVDCLATAPERPL